MTLQETLATLGFAEDAQARQVAIDNAEAQGLGHNGAYTVVAVYTRGDAVLTVEQNNSPEDLGGLTAVIEHPPLAILQTPRTRVAFNPEDTELAERLLAELG